jgi:small-conductance mechanosensitive channel
MKQFLDIVNEVKDFLSIELFKFNNIKINLYNVLIGLGIIIVTSLLLRLYKRVYKKLVARHTIDAGTAHSIYSIVKYLIWVVVIVLLLDTLGVKVSILIASAAALLVGVGLGLQQLFNDVASGIILLIERSLKVDDVVEMENEMIGRVVSIGIRTSKLKTRDNVLVIVPNSQLVNDRVINWSHVEKLTRFHVDVGVAYGSDIKLVTELLKDCANAHEHILIEPAAFVRFVNFGESSLDFQLYFWTNEAFIVENTKSDLRYKIDKAFRENNIEIPFPQRDVYIKSQKTT